uniref:F-box domain-containing protein n=1 Tax=Leersia perrieri TaxID=77586 RepID=A0A0D9XA29_9ORYZ
MVVLKKSCSIHNDTTFSSSDDGESEITKLTDDLLAEIILKLPLKSMARSMSVSKNWLAAISSDDYLRGRLPPQITTVYFPDDAAAAPRFACAAGDGDGLEDRDIGFFLPESAADGGGGGDVVVCDGSNGLLLCRITGGTTPPEFVVADPVTRRWAAIPSPSSVATLSVLAFDPSTSPDHYRVINFNAWRDGGATVEAYSSATRAWASHDADFGGVPASSLSATTHYHTGVVYILAAEPDCVVCLDATNFTSTVIPLPADQNSGEGHVTHSGGRLHYVISDGEQLKVWELIDDAFSRQQWRLKHDVSVGGGGGDEVRFLAMHPENGDVAYTWTPWKVMEYDLRRKRSCRDWEFWKGERNRVVKTWLVPSSLSC